MINFAQSGPKAISMYGDEAAQVLEDRCPSDQLDALPGRGWGRKPHLSSASLSRSLTTSRGVTWLHPLFAEQVRVLPEQLAARKGSNQ